MPRLDRWGQDFVAKTGSFQQLSKGMLYCQNLVPVSFIASIGSSKKGDKTRLNVLLDLPHKEIRQVVR